jgi:hypothetical protein
VRIRWCSTVLNTHTPPAPSDVPDFDPFMAIRRIPLAQEGESFAEYLTLEHGWVGQFERIDFRRP